jgi:hypothetical protein
MYRILVIDYSSENQVLIKKKLFNIKAIISYASNLKTIKYYLNSYEFDLILFGVVKERDSAIIKDYLNGAHSNSIVFTTSNSDLPDYCDTIDGILDIYQNDKSFLSNLENLIHSNEAKLINEGVELKCIHKNH